MEQRATVFGADAVRYDRTRPGYPDEVIDPLISRWGMQVLDVGCGTGIASRLFADRGCRVLGIEPDERMADVARARGLDVEIAGFEDWDAKGRTFDLVVSAQAWHWLEPTMGARLARGVLVNSASLAVLWNVPRHDPEVQAAFDEVYDRYRLPDGTRCSPPGALAEGSEQYIEGIVAAGGFAAPREVVHDWVQSYTAAEWVDLLPTHSDHRLMDPTTLEELLAATADVIESFSGRIEVTYTAHLVSAEALEPGG